MQTILGKHWHHLPETEVASLLDSDLEQGLDLFDVQRRQKRFGPNVLAPAKKQSQLVRFLTQFNNPLIYILLASSLITALIKDLVDALIILGVVLINALIGYIQEARAEQAIEALANAMNTEASVIRAGESRRIPASELVPGDLVILRSGDKVPADLRLVRSRDLQIAEATLTGESVAVIKQVGMNLAEDTPLAERRNMAYTSTLVTGGQGAGLVTAIGDGTEIGRISALIGQAEPLATPLTRKISRFSQLVLYLILGLAAVAFLIGVLRGQSVVDTFTAAVALAVAMIPEGLPAALTVTLAIGVARMARQRAIIRKLPAVEALGSTTLICSDKTGTLTQNQMTVQQIWVGGEKFALTGSGYDSAGQILRLGQVADHRAYPGLGELLAAGVLCNDSALQPTGAGWLPEGDPTEVALLIAAEKSKLDHKALVKQRARLDSLPFKSQNQYMASLNRLEEGRRRLYIKGAVEVVLAGCLNQMTASGMIEPLETGEIVTQVEQFAGRGLRVLAFSSLDLPESQEQIDPELNLAGMTFLGLQAMMDPPRPEAIEAVAAVQAAGIQVKMITGDHALTAAAIASALGILPADGRSASELAEERVLTGQQLASLKDRELIERAEEVDVFARVSPEQKLRLVEALQARSQVVAMTGDGVNDGPALKQADIGIAMGITGTDVAKEAADMVLTDDLFSTIRAAVEEGRVVFDNLTRIIAWTLPTNIGQGLIILAALLVGVDLPILPIQVLWINMTSVGLLGLTLALEGREADIMRRPPRRPDAPILTGELVWRTLLVGILILTGAFGLFEWELFHGASLAEARTVAVNAVIAVLIFYLFNCRSLSQSMFRIGIFSNPWVWAGVAGMVALQLMFTYIPVMNRVLYSAPLEPDAWLRILGFGLLSYSIVEVEKWIRRGGGA